MDVLEDHPSVEQLLREAAPRAVRPLARRERLTEVTAAVALVLVSAGLLLVAPADEIPWGTGALLVLLFAAASRVRFRAGSAGTAPTQLVLVPMLLLLPAPLVPLLVAVALLLARLPEHVRRQVHPDRALLHFGDAWFAVGPALVLVAAGPAEPAVRHWPVYVAAFAAQLLVDAIASMLREWAAAGVAPSLQLRIFVLVAGVDSALAPIGLLAALKARAEPLALLLVVPLLGLLAGFAHERERRIENALALSEAYRGSALLMGEMLEADDPYTGGEHSHGVVALALAVGRELGLDAREQRDLEFGALLHDIGKLKVPDEILNKPGKLSPAEWEVIRRHPVDGQAMLDRIGGVLAEVGLTVRGHHERWDGGGYPDGLRGEAIPLNARIICACDAYSAMTTNRSYRAAMPSEDALAELRACAGTQFDPRIVDAITAVVERETPPQLAAVLAA
jgi:HD-GYP domain-containing protein (c-di-GMP phosphodiesterase class II)